MKQKKSEKIKQITLSLIMAVISVQCALSIWRRYQEFLSKGSIVPSFLLICTFWIVGILFIYAILWRPELLRPFLFLKKLPDPIRRMGSFFICLLPIFLYTFHRWSEPFGNPWIRIFLYTVIILAAAWLLTKEKGISGGALIASMLAFSVSFLLINQFRDLTDYPFSVGWSEGNRFWDYSVLFGRRLYNWPQDKPIPAYIDLGRQSLWGAIFLLPKVTIRMMRAWNDFLFTIPYALLGWALLNYRSVTQKKYLLAGSLWAMIFLNQGPIYTPLVLATILVALGHKLPLWLGCLFTFLAGAYAVMSRSTWIVAPAIYGGMLTLADTYDKKILSQKRRWFQAILIGLFGIAGAFSYLNQYSIRAFFSESSVTEKSTVTVPLNYGEEYQSVDTSPKETEASESVPAMLTPAWFQYYLSRQPLLWNRLWPNETYKLGIVPGLLMAVLPLVLLLIFWDHEKHWNLSGMQRLVLGCILFAFLCVGLIVSVKIGGGSNLHNLDMFLIALLIIAAMAWNAGMGEWLIDKVHSGHWINWIILAAIILPVLPAMLTVEPKKYPDPSTTGEALAKVQQVIAQHAQEEILFMDQRQLLTFGYVPKIPLIADYEKKWMMDEAMADNAEWFKPYIHDLKNQRFAVIISEPLQIKFQGANRNFSEENDLFVKWVSIPTLCYYEPLETFEEQGVQILVPRKSVLVQEGVTCP